MGPIVEERDQTKPATEWILGRPVQKVSPRTRHARVQGRVVVLLARWAEEHGAGRVGPEWDFRLEPPGEERRTLVPDVAYLSFERQPYDGGEEIEFPLVAPDVAFEVLSPDNRTEYVQEKVRVYLACGTRAVVLLDPRAETVTVHEASGARLLRGDDRFELAALPGLRIPCSEFFVRPKPKS